jgi:hypothetical protein
MSNMAEGAQATSGIPRRHGVDPASGRRMAAPLKLLIRGNPEPSPAQWQAMGLALNQGDPPMDRLLAWMSETGLRETRPLFDRALRDGIDSLPDAPAPLREFFALIDQRPAWVDEALLQEGARCCGISGLSGLRALRDMGLMAGYQASAINRTLLLTGALQRGPQRRLAETTKWWIDVTRPGGVARDAPGFHTTLQVRLVHAHVRRHVQQLPEWDAAYYGLPVNQFDMQATYLSFCVTFLFGQRLLGVPLRAEEGRAVMHLWRYIGWLMGVDEPWLLDGEMEGRIALYQNVLAQAPPDESSRLLGRPLMDEPLQRHYRRFAWLQGRYERARHLSIERAFLGRAGMQALGLPTLVLPWYPVLSFAPRLLGHLLLRAWPGGRERLIRDGLRKQSDYLQVLFGGDRPDILQRPATH